MVNMSDLLAVAITQDPCLTCPEDINSDGNVNVVDLLIVVGNWGYEALVTWGYCH